MHHPNISIGREVEITLMNQAYQVKHPPAETPKFPNNLVGLDID